MKKKKLLLNQPIAFFLFMLSVIQVFGQHPYFPKSSDEISDFSFIINNDVQVSDNVLEFDLYLIDTDAANTFELAAIQAGILVNPAIYNGGTLSVAIVAGSSELVSTQQPSNVIWSQAQNTIKLTPRTGPGPGNGTIISTSAPGTRICRLRLTNTVSFTANSTADLLFNFTTVPYPTKVFQYIGGLNTQLACNATNCISNAYNITLNPTINTWRGATDTDWNTATNWSSGTVPLSGVDAIIATSANNPTLTGSVNLTNLTINSTASLNIANNGQLTVSISLTNNAGNSGIIVKSIVNGTGSLIHSSAGVTGRVERYIAGYSDNNHGWHLLSSPVITQPISDFHTAGSGNDFYKWDESTNTWINRTADGGGLNGSFETNFGVGTGYLIANAATSTKTFSGSLNVSNVSVTGLSNTPASTNSGWHLLGNPFPSALIWNDGNWNFSNVDANCQIWNEANASYSVILPNGIIPSMNGFMAHASADGASMTIPALSRTHDATNWYKNAEQMEQIVITVRDIDGETAQPTIIRFEQGATSGYDSQFDSYFLPGFAPIFYSSSLQENYALNTLPELSQGMTIPLGFVKNTGNQFVIELTENIQGQAIYLTDKQTLQTVKLNEGDYAFSAQQGDNADRFELHFGVVGIEDNTLADASLHAWASNGQLYLHNEQGPVTLMISDLQGRILLKTNTASAGVTSFPLNLSSSIYIVSIQSADRFKSMKIFVR